MHAAARKGDAEEVKRLIEGGKDSTEADSRQQLHATHLVCGSREAGVDQDQLAETVHALVNAWPESLYSVDCMDNTPLIFAASNGNPKSVPAAHRKRSPRYSAELHGR